MKRLLLCLLLLLLSAIIAGATTITQSKPIVAPNGTTLFTGTITAILQSPATRTDITQFLLPTPIVMRVVAGNLVSANYALVGNDVLSPKQAYYVQYKDSTGALLTTTHWFITGTTFDVASPPIFMPSNVIQILDILGLRTVSATTISATTGSFTNLFATSWAIAGPPNFTTNLGGSRYLSDSPMGPYLLKVNPVLDVGIGGSGEDQIVGDMWVVKDPSTGKCHGFYSMVAAGFTASGIGHATSDDCQTWTKDGGNPVVPATANKPTVVPNICGSNWCLYALRNAGDGSFNLYTASSLSGPWTAFSGNPVLSPGGSQQATSFLAVSAFIENGTLNLIYAASDSVDFVNRIFLATSTDGKTFAKQGKIVDVGAGGQWDAGWIAPGSVVKTAEGLYVMSYNAGNGVPAGGNLEPSPQGIGFLYSASLLGGWTRYTANPVIKLDTLRFESNTVWRGYLWQLGSKYLLSVDAGDSNNIERQFIAEQVRWENSSVGGINVPTLNSTQIKGPDAALTLWNTTGGRTTPSGQYRLASRGDVDALAFFRCGSTSTESACNNATELMRIPNGGGWMAAEQTAPTGLPNFDEFYPDSTCHCWKAINNNGAAVQLVVTGGDINTSNQVTVTHLASALPVNQGGTGQTVASTFPTTAGAIPTVFSCGGTAACGNSALGNTARVFQGACPFSASTTCTVTGMSPAFSSSGSYTCTVTNGSNHTTLTYGLTYVSGASFTITASGSNSDFADYICAGN